MVRKIRNLIRDLKDAGFVLLSDRGAGDHQLWRHPETNTTVGLDGKDRDDAKPYQEERSPRGHQQEQEGARVRIHAYSSPVISSTAMIDGKE
jgi:hypothetical protein